MPLIDFNWDHGIIPLESIVIGYSRMFAACTCDRRIIHFIGIGGIGMSGLAEILQSLGYMIQGSDKATSQNVDRLEKIGITTFIGHNSKNVENANVVVFSSAISQDNPELLRARELKIPCLSRAEMLSQIVRFKKSVVVAGSHGKTTVTSICATILEMASLSPTIVNGGVINAYHTNAKLGSGDWSVVESDESDGSFTKFFPTIGIITNIDREHILHYGSFESLKTAFRTFIDNLPFYGAGVACIDDREVLEVVRNITDRKIITYGIDNPDAMIRAVNIRKHGAGAVFDVGYLGTTINSVSISLLGDHNILNALAAIGMAMEVEVDIEVVKSTLATFTGVNRRFTLVGTLGGACVIDDYAHHPTEIKALLKSARQRESGKVMIICQPHRLTRLNMLFTEFRNCFNEADEVVIAPVYQPVYQDPHAEPNALLTSDDLYVALQEDGKNVKFVHDKSELQEFLNDMIVAGKLCDNDIVLFSGAGDISNWAYEIVSKIGTRQ
ncbi:MAG: UDP-N-acetylmuramate--L-alanine ligase [Holosporales bacterium]|jgi:UDP-N-acetylmuramate--alanine ligase|nr:UDP-N-acetylmuramate--L-alanine ligase [Holosporales bacterium]